MKEFLSWLMHVDVFESIKRFYGNLIDLIGFIVDKTSDQGADIAIRALPIVSPLPNAISMYYVSQTALHFTDWQAKAFAAAMELALFGLFEVVLKMFDGWQKNPVRYKITLYLATGIAIFVMLLIIGVVWFVETDRPILATLPLFSAAGAAALSLRRWHAHNEQAELASERARLEAKAQQKSVARVARIESLALPESVNQSQTGDYESSILTYYRLNPLASQRKAATDLSLSQARVNRVLSDLESRRIIHRNGNGVEILG